MRHTAAKQRSLVLSKPNNDLIGGNYSMAFGTKYQLSVSNFFNSAPVKLRLKLAKLILVYQFLKLVDKKSAKPSLLWL